MISKIIGIGFQKQSGKDTVAENLVELLKPSTALVFHFADQLKTEVSEATGVSIKNINKDKPIWRPMLQWWGTEFRRHYNGPNYWIKQLEELINFYTSEYKIIADVRFKNEAEWIKSKGGILIHVIRDSVYIQDDLHPSEVEGHQIEWDFRVNNFSGLAELRQESIKAIETIKVLFNNKL